MTNFNLDEIGWRLVEGLQPEQIILFGSYAYGQPTKASDLDIMIIISESTEPAYRRAQQAYRHLRGIRVPIDLIVLTQEEVAKQRVVVTSLARQVVERGKILYERSEARRDSKMANQKSA